MILSLSTEASLCSVLSPSTTELFAGVGAALLSVVFPQAVITAIPDKVKINNILYFVLFIISPPVIIILELDNYHN